MAAFVAEPILGASAGAAVPPEDYAAARRGRCRRHGVLYIDDEVMTGFGRTGAWFASEWSGVRPDIVTCGKGMSGGYVPVGGVLARPRDRGRCCEAAGGFVHGFTFSHHPVTAAACLATLDILERERLVERARAMGVLLRERARAAARAPARGRRARPRPACGASSSWRTWPRAGRSRAPRAGPRPSRPRCLRGRARRLPEQRLRERHRRRRRDAGAAVRGDARRSWGDGRHPGPRAVRALGL